jgi:serine/threonine protein kinase
MIKPSSIKLEIDVNPNTGTYDNITIKLTDFGLCKYANNEGQLQLRNIIHNFDNPSFSAPEFCDCYHKKNDLTIDWSLDLWSFGCITFYLMTRLPPFSDQKN